MTQEPTQELLSHIRDRAIVYADITLSSGATSTWYADLRRLSLAAGTAPLLGSALLRLTGDWDYEAAGVLTLGADPLALAMLHAGHRFRALYDQTDLPL